MKKYLLVVLALLWHGWGLAETITCDMILLHVGTQKFSFGDATYQGAPIFFVEENEKVSVFVYKKDAQLQDCSGNIYIDGVLKADNGCGYVINQLSYGKLHSVKRKSTGRSATYESTGYLSIKPIPTISQTTCSKVKMPITIWHNNGDITRWERSYDGGNTWTNIACTDYQYTESNPTAGTAKYRVLGANGTYSDVVTITYVDAVPSTIQATPATNTITVDESVRLTANVTDNGYSYQWKKDGKAVSGSTATSRSFNISKVKSSHAGNYTCEVSNGCNSVTTTTAKLIVNKCAQVIDFPEIPVQTYSSGLTYTLPEKTNKGLTITYQSMNTSVATVSGNTLTIKAPGTAVISASQAGDDNYLEATQVSRTLTVNKRSQTITFNALPTKTYEDLPFTLPQKTDEGLTISYTSTNTSVATVSGNTVTILKPGTTDIIASQAGDATHYAAAEVSQTLTVNKAAQQITFEALASKTYGDASFTLNKVSNKNLTITYTSSDASIASVSGNRVKINHPGSVIITASQAGDAYYLAAEPVSQTLIINKANQTINFPALESRAYGSGDFELPIATDKGLPVKYESSNLAVATVTHNNEVHIEGAGTTTFTATQGGNEYYNAAQSVSQSLTITKATQTISFPDLPTCVYGQDAITLNATVNSGLEIEYESSDYSVAQISGNKLAIVGAGQCFITASASGNKNYYTATPVEKKLIVNKAAQSIDFVSLAEEYTYGDSPITLVANSNSGEVRFSSSNPSKLMIVGSSAIIQGAGEFSITASLAEDANHLPVSVSQEIVVNKAELTITADNVSRLYGDNNPAFTYKYKGFVNGDTRSDLTSTIQVSSNATPMSPVGSYEIVTTATVDENYKIICKKGVLTIDKAPLTITSSATREYGDNNPNFTFAYTGFKNNEDYTVLTSQPQAYTTAKKTSAVGTYPIYISGASAQNYSFTYDDGALEIKKAPLTIKALDVSRKRLTENPPFELSISGYKLEDSIDDLDRLPTIQCAANVNSPAGTYPIILLNDGYATNYEYTLINGTLTIEKLRYTVSVASEDEAKGRVSGGGTYDEDDAISISAIPNPHYYFTRWNDGNTEQTRSIIVLQDASYTAYFAVERYSLTVTSNNNNMGTVSGSGEFDYGETAELSATSNEGYHFTQWSDGNKDNPRRVTVTKDETFMAEFAKNIYTITTITDEEQGSISGPAQAEYLDQVTLIAVSQYGYHFTQWSDGVTDNPRTFEVTSNMTFTAEFAVDKSGTCGDNLQLEWIYDSDSKTLTISGNGNLSDNKRYGVEAIREMTTLVVSDGIGVIGESAFANIKTLQTLTLGNSITDIGDYAFSGCSKLTSVTLPDNMKSIGRNAFAGCTIMQQLVLGKEINTIRASAFADCLFLIEVKAYMVLPPVIEASVFSGCGDLSNIKCYVPMGSLAYYQKLNVWNEFNLIESTFKGEDAVEYTNSDAHVSIRKELRNGQLFIIRGGRTWNVQGCEVR